MQWLQANWFELITAVSFIISGASIITKFTKTPKDDAIIGKILNFLALIPKNGTK